MDMIQFGIECNSCAIRWKLKIPVTKANIGAFCGICTCGNIIVGNINFQSLRNKTSLEEFFNDLERFKTVVLGNGSYSFVSFDSIDDLPELNLED